MMVTTFQAITNQANRDARVTARRLGLAAPAAADVPE